MKRITTILIFFTCLILSSTAFARDHRNHEKKMEKLSDRLDLTSEQEQKLREIFEAAKEGDTCKDIDSRAAHRECREAKRATINAEISKMLDDGQLEEFAEMQERRLRRKNRRGRN